MTALPFAGPDYDPSRDHGRLTNQHQRIKWLMQDGEWRTLRQISESLNYPPASVSAQLRFLRRPAFGGYEVERKHIGNGLYAYRVVRGGTAPTPRRRRRIEELFAENAKLRARIAELEGAR